MANYAFIDERRTEKIYADADNIMNYKSVRCYCKNPNCDARMFIYMPEHRNLAYFKASGSPGHAGACGIAPFHFSKEDYNEAEFIYPGNLMNLMNPPKRKNNNHNVYGNHESAHNRALSGLKETYTMLTNTDIDDRYNGYLIRDMLADERTLPTYKERIEGYKIVECNFYKYNDNANLICMNYPPYPNNVRTLELWFDDDGVYDSIKKRIKGKKHDGIVIVFGEWRFNPLDNVNYVNITSERQIAVVKKES